MSQFDRYVLKDLVSQKMRKVRRLAAVRGLTPRRAFNQVEHSPRWNDQDRELHSAYCAAARMRARVRRMT